MLNHATNLIQSRSRQAEKQLKLMNKTLQESKCLASLAVFRELYNSKKDISEIISEFLIEIIITESKHNS